MGDKGFNCGTNNFSLLPTIGASMQDQYKLYKRKEEIALIKQSFLWGCYKKRLERKTFVQSKAI